MSPVGIGAAAIRRRKGGGPVTYVAHASYSNPNNANVNFTLPASIQEGDLLFLHRFFVGSTPGVLAAPWAPARMTLDSSRQPPEWVHSGDYDAMGASGARCDYRIADAATAGSTISVGGAGASGSMGILAILRSAANPRAAMPPFVSSAIEAQGVSPLVLPSISPTFPPFLLAFTVGDWGGAPSLPGAGEAFTPGTSGMTERIEDAPGAGHIGRMSLFTQQLAVVGATGTRSIVVGNVTANTNPKAGGILIAVEGR